MEDREKRNVISLDLRGSDTGRAATSKMALSEEAVILLGVPIMFILVIMVLLIALCPKAA